MTDMPFGVDMWLDEETGQPVDATMAALPGCAGGTWLEVPFKVYELPWWFGYNGPPSQDPYDVPRWDVVVMLVAMFLMVALLGWILMRMFV